MGSTPAFQKEMEKEIPAQSTVLIHTEITSRFGTPGFGTQICATWVSGRANNSIRLSLLFEFRRTVCDLGNSYIYSLKQYNCRSKYMVYKPYYSGA